MRKELWFGFSLMAIIVAVVLIFTPWGNVSQGHLGLIMLALIVVAIMLGDAWADAKLEYVIFSSDRDGPHRLYEATR